MNNPRKTTRIYFCFPDDVQSKNLKNFIDKLVEQSKENTDDEESKWGGFLGKSYLADALKNKFDNKNYEKYTTPDNKILKKIKSDTEDSLEKSRKVLPSRKRPVRVFVYPWFPGENEKVFEGVIGTTFFGSTFHLYIDTENFSTKSLKDTTAHEYNHSVYFSYHHPFKQSILEAVILEGLAEHFREKVIGGKPAPWSIALEKDGAVEQFKDLKEKGYLDINMQDSNEDYWSFYEEVFYGKGSKYKQWTGHSIGYHIIEALKSASSGISWENLIKQKPEKILEKSRFPKS